MCIYPIMLLFIGAHDGVLCINVHCHVKFNAMFKLIACVRNFFVVILHVLTLVLVDLFS